MSSPDAVRNGPSIAATATAVPPHLMSRDKVKTYFEKAFTLDPRRLSGIHAVVDNSQIENRFSVFPLDYFIEARSLAQISQEYQECAIRLGRQVTEDCLERARLKPTDIDMFVTVSCTGVMIPSLDAHLMNQLGFRSDVRRLPITELGCAAGAAAFTRAWEYLQAYPDRNVLIVAVELPTLTFQRGDLSQANLVSCALFGDGAGAAIVTGRPTRGPQILASESYLFPDSIAAMGFDLRDTGFHIVLSRDVPQLIRSKIKGLVNGFLETNGIAREQLSAFILHPGGQKLLAYLEEELGLCRCETQLSWDVLRDFGNLSSATILFVLHEWLTKKTIAAGQYGLMAAFGPGFSSEMLLLRWK